MLVGNPVRGEIRPDARFYSEHPLALHRPAGSNVPLVTQDFGPSSVDVEPTVDWPGGEFTILGKPIPAKTYPNFHRALDLSKGGCGSDILAAAAGTVKVSNKNESRANVIVIDHGIIDGKRYQTGYVHLAQRLVEVGAEVEAGDVIGTLGDTGLSTGCHLHFYIKKNKRYVDPWRRLKQNTSIDPDAPRADEPVEPAPVDDESADPIDTPMAACDEALVAGTVAVIGNTDDGALVRDRPETDATILRVIEAGERETWLARCWVKGDRAFDSNRWLTRTFEGEQEFTHQVNVESVTAP